jgi:hypothetical protein
MARRADMRDFVFDLEGTAEGSAYRVQVKNDSGEKNRQVIINNDDPFLTVGTLLDVIHGKTRVGGDDATLIIANFQFVPSGNKRFVSANLTWTFSCDDPAVNIAVEQITPHGNWVLDAVTLKVDQAVSGNASISPQGGPISAGSLGGEYRRGTAKEVVRHTSVQGTQRMEARHEGGFDSVRWHLRENENDKQGICRMLRVGVLLTQRVRPGMKPRPGTPIFQGNVDIVVEKGFWSKGKEFIKPVWKKADKDKDEPVLFQRTEERVSGLFDDLIDRDSLAAVNLTDDIMSMSMHEDFGDLRKAREKRRQKKLEEQQEKVREEEERRRKQKEEEKKEESKQAEAESRSESRGNEAAGLDGGQRVLTQTLAHPPPSSFPPWVAYIALGVLLMYAWQKLVALLGGG